jgi:hypothetical protein
MEMSLKDLKELLATDGAQSHPYQIGDYYMIRTVTMIFTGRLVAVFKDELLLTSCHWVAETARWNEFIAETKTNEHESYGNREVIVGRGSVIDACVLSKLPEGNK